MAKGVSCSAQEISVKVRGGDGGNGARKSACGESFPEGEGIAKGKLVSRDRYLNEQFGTVALVLPKFLEVIARRT